MTANAVANHLQKKVLLVTVSVLVEKDLTKVGDGHPAPLSPTSLSLSVPTGPAAVPVSRG